MTTGHAFAQLRALGPELVRAQEGARRLYLRLPGLQLLGQAGAWPSVRSGGAGLGVYVCPRQWRVYDDLLTQELPDAACQKLIRGRGILFKKPLGGHCPACKAECKLSSPPRSQAAREQPHTRDSQGQAEAEPLAGKARTPEPQTWGGKSRCRACPTCHEPHLPNTRACTCPLWAQATPEGLILRIKVDHSQLCRP